MVDSELERSGRRRTSSRSGVWAVGEELRVLGTDAVGVEVLRVAELGVDIDDEAVAAAVGGLFAQEVDGEVAGELDEAVVAGLCND